MEEMLSRIDEFLGIDTDAYNDDYDIKDGMPKWCELAVIPMFFPRLARGLDTIYGTLKIKALNLVNPYAPDIGIYVDGASGVLCAVEVERKTPRTNYLFDHHYLPLNIPVYSFASHTGSRWPMTFSGKWRLFNEHPERSFFMAVSHDAQRGLITRGADIIEARQEWVQAYGPFAERRDEHNGQIYVARVDRNLCLLAEAGETAERFILYHVFSGRSKE